MFVSPPDRTFRIAQLSDDIKHVQENLSVFVAGPFIELDKAIDVEPNNRNDSSKLRYNICSELNSLNCEIYLGEDHRLRTGGIVNYGVHSNAVVYERHYIKEHFDCVIILPSSPGSFCEFGDWVASKDICQKMKVIIDLEYQGKLNYVNTGPVHMAQSYGASVSYIDYKQLNAVNDSCREFIQRIISQKRIERLYDRA